MAIFHLSFKKDFRMVYLLRWVSVSFSYFVFGNNRLSSQKFSLQLHDRRYEEFNSRLPWETFPGKGQAVCGDKDESASSLSSHFPGLFCKRHPDQSRGADPQRLCCHSHVFFWFKGKKLTTDQFLNKLPKLVVKAGRVIDIRNSLRAKLQVSRREAAIICLYKYTDEDKITSHPTKFKSFVKIFPSAFLNRPRTF